MSVFVSDFTSDTAWTITHDDYGHVNEVDPTTINFIGTNADGSVNQDFILIQCPTCGDASVQPVSGGDHPMLVQTLFVMLTFQQQSSVARTTIRSIIADVHARCNALERDDNRWCIVDKDLENEVYARAHP